MDRAHKVDLDHSRKTRGSWGDPWNKKGQTFKGGQDDVTSASSGQVSSDTDYRQDVCNQCLSRWHHALHHAYDVILIVDKYKNAEQLSRGPGGHSNTRLKALKWSQWMWVEILAYLWLNHICVCCISHYNISTTWCLSLDFTCQQRCCRVYQQFRMQGVCVHYAVE